MALTITKPRSGSYSSLRAKPFSVLFDNSYPTGGEPVTAADVGLESHIDAILLGPAVSAAGSHVLICAYDPATSKFRLFYPTGGTETPPTTVAQPVATVVPDAGAVGLTGSAAKPTLTAVTTPGAGKEVPNTFDASGYTVHGIAFGI